MEPPEHANPSTDPPKPPYIVPFEEEGEDVLPLALEVGGQVGGRNALPLFDSRKKAEEFLVSMSLQEKFRPAELSRDDLIQLLTALRGVVGYVAINPPPATESGLRVRMGSLDELTGALAEGRDEVDLFDFLSHREDEGPNGSG